MPLGGGLGEAALEAFGHLVDGFRKVFQGITLSDGQALRKITRADRFQGPGDSLERSDDLVALANTQVIDDRDGKNELRQQGDHGPEQRGDDVGLVSKLRAMHVF